MLDNGVDVMLPEDDRRSALDRGWSPSTTRAGLLSRDIAAVDLRFADRLVVQLTEDGAVAREAALKERDKLAKKKGSRN